MGFTYVKIDCWFDLSQIVSYRQTKMKLKDVSKEKRLIENLFSVREGHLKFMRSKFFKPSFRFLY